MEANEQKITIFIKTTLYPAVDCFDISFSPLRGLTINAVTCETVELSVELNSNVMVYVEYV